VAAELGLQGRLQKVNVSALNDHVKAFVTSPVECTIESLDGKTIVSVIALKLESFWGPKSILFGI